MVPQGTEIGPGGLIENDAFDNQSYRSDTIFAGKNADDLRILVVEMAIEQGRSLTPIKVGWQAMRSGSNSTTVPSRMA